MLLLPVEGYVKLAGHFSASDTASYMFQGPWKNERPLKNLKTVLFTIHASHCCQHACSWDMYYKGSGAYSIESFLHVRIS